MSVETAETPTADRAPGVAQPAPLRGCCSRSAWLLWAAFPLGLIAVLVLGGQTGPLRPARPDKRLTGGSAFLLTVGVNSVAATTVTATIGRTPW